MHKLLIRQLNKLDLADSIPPSPQQWTQFLSRIDAAYQQIDQDRYLLERSLTISSEEMRRLYETLQKSSEAQLAIEHDKLQAVLASVGDGLCVLDQQGTILYINTTGEQLLGISQAAAKGRAFVDLVMPVDPSPDNAVAQLNQSILSGESCRLDDACFKRNDNTTFPVSFALSPVNSHSQLVSMVIVFRDISSQKQLELAMALARDAAENANRTKSEFLANMSHEIRTPLNGILGFSDLLRRGAETDASERQDWCQTIYSSGQHLQAVINNILDLSKIEAGQMVLERMSCSLPQIISNAISILKSKAVEKNLSIDICFETPIPNQIDTDPTRLRQLLMNLIGNAIKFTLTGGITVAVSLHEHATKPKLQFRISDTGIGMTPEQLQALFRPFVQADSSVTRRFGGTGLGLAISKQLAEALGGSITVTSQPNIGSTFTLQVDVLNPLGHVDKYEEIANNLKAEPNNSDASTQQPSNGPCRILVVDDGDTNRDLVALILKRTGAEIVLAENGQEAVDLATTNNFNIILMDMQMPVMDGYAATSILRQKAITCPIIAFTAHAMKDDARKCLEAGCSGYLSKPVDSQTLLKTVSDALKGSPTAQQQTPQPDPTFKSTSDPNKPDSNRQDSLYSQLPLDDPEIREIVIEFISTLQNKYAQIEHAGREQQWSELAKLAHWLKGTAGTAGYPDFGPYAAKLEQLSLSHQADQIDDCVAQIRQLMDRAAVGVQSQPHS